MNFIAVDLKVIEVKAPATARAADVEPDRVLGGLVRLWHLCWSSKSDKVSEIELAGIFGGSRIEQLIAALVGFELLEVVEDGWRVKGADRYLRIQESRVAGGKMAAARGNLRRGNSSPASSQLAPSSLPAAPQLPPSLSPSTEHRTPIKDKKPVAKKFATPVDPRLEPLKLALVADYETVRIGERYRHSGAPDTNGLKSLLPLATDEQIRSRWRDALRRTEYPKVSTFAQLAQKWPDLAAPSKTRLAPIDADKDYPTGVLNAPTC